MRRLLNHLCRNRFTAAITGVVITATTQSSSVTTVLLVGFVSAGLMTLQQSIGVIMGANIGSTITAQLIAFKITHYALVPVALGFALKSLGPNARTRQSGASIMGLGLVFFGMALMSHATQPLRTFEPFVRLMEHLATPLVGIAAGAVFTAVVQSSAATMGLAIILLGEGLISLPGGIALAFGANIGTCATAMLASIGQSRPAWQTASVHVMFNVIGVLLWLPFVDYLIEAVQALGTDPARQLANAHTLFNVANTIVFIGLTGPIAWLVRKMLPIRPAPETVVLEPKFLDAVYLKTPAIALDLAHREVVRLGELTAHFAGRARKAIATGDEADLDELAPMDNDIDHLYRAIVEYLRQLIGRDLADHEADRADDLLAMAQSLEAIGDLYETSLVELGRERIRHGLVISPQTESTLLALHGEARVALRHALDAMAGRDKALAKQVTKRRKDFAAMARAAHRQVSRRLGADADHRADTFMLETELIDVAERLYALAHRIADRVKRDPALEDAA